LWPEGCAQVTPATLLFRSLSRLFAAGKCPKPNKRPYRIKNPVVGQDSGSVTQPPKNCRENSKLQVANSGSSIPLNVLGGYQWPGAPKIDSETLERIRRLEIGALVEAAK
jgi:hypothetical protein